MYLELESLTYAFAVENCRLPLPSASIVELDARILYANDAVLPTDFSLKAIAPNFDSSPFPPCTPTSEFLTDFLVNRPICLLALTPTVLDHIALPTPHQSSTLLPTNLAPHLNRTLHPPMNLPSQLRRLPELDKPLPCQLRIKRSRSLIHRTVHRPLHLPINEIPQNLHMLNKQILPVHTSEENLWAGNPLNLRETNLDGVRHESRRKVSQDDIARSGEESESL